MEVDARHSRIACRWLFGRGVGVALVAAVAYVLIAPAHIGGGDNAEFATLGSIGGVPHPSGYPLYMLWLRATSWLPAATPAHATAIATSLLAAAQVFVLHAACRAWSARAGAASIATAVFAASPLVLMFHTEAEVFALNGLVVAVVLLLAAPAGPLRGEARTIVLALVAGLGLSNHSTCVLVTPLGLLGAVRGLQETRRSRPAVVGMAVLALVAGFLPYLYLFVTSSSSISWRPIEDLSGLVHHFLRADYGSSRLTSTDMPVPYLAQLGALFRSLASTWSAPGAVLGLLVLVERAVRCPPSEGRREWQMLLASVCLAGPVLLTRFNIDPIGTGLMVCQRFHLLPLALLCIPVAVGIDRVLARVPRSRLTRPIVIHGFALLTFVALTARSLPHHMRAQSPAIERMLRGSFASMPPEAVVIVAAESLYFGAGYVQDVLGERRDITVIGWLMMRSPEYRDRIRARSGLKLAPSSEGLRSADVAAEVLASGRPLFIAPFGAKIAEAFPTHPYGMLFRVYPRGAPMPSLREQVQINRELLERFRLDYPFPEADDEPTASFHVFLARGWAMLAEALARSGETELASEASAIAEEVGP